MITSAKCSFSLCSYVHRVCIHNSCVRCIRNLTCEFPPLANLLRASSELSTERSTASRWSEREEIATRRWKRGKTAGKEIDDDVISQCRFLQLMRENCVIDRRVNSRRQKTTVVTLPRCVHSRYRLIQLRNTRLNRIEMNESGASFVTRRSPLCWYDEQWFYVINKHYKGQ